jgi:hypothetical protein
MTARTALLSCALVFSSGLLSGPCAVHAGEKPKVASVAVDLSGPWTYNRGLSDDARAKMREAMEKGAGQGSRPPGGGGMGGDDDPSQAMRAILEPAEALVITQTEAEIAVEEEFGETRHLHPDGKKYKTDNGASEIKVSWKEGRLVVETTRGRGGRVVETWERVPDGSQLIVNVKVEGGFGPGLTLRRVYDRQGGSGAR